MTSLSDLTDRGALPPTLDTAAAAELLGCRVDTLWKLAREGNAPVEPLRLGRALRWPTVAVLKALGFDESSIARVASGDRGPDA